MQVTESENGAHIRQLGGVSIIVDIQENRIL
jgi:hypothetical protein